MGQVGQMLPYLTSMDVNLCFTALMLADLHKLWRRYIKTIYSFIISAVSLIPGLHYLPDTDVRYCLTLALNP